MNPHSDIAENPASFIISACARYQSERSGTLGAREQNGGVVARQQAGDEYQPARLAAHAGLALPDPDPAFLGDISACALRRHQLFFYT